MKKLFLLFYLALPPFFSSGQAGALDNSFDTDGKVVTSFTSSGDRAYAVAVQPDGKILVAGQAYPSFFVARYLSNGAPDNTFGGDGMVTVSLIFDAVATC